MELLLLGQENRVCPPSFISGCRYTCSSKMKRAPFV